MAWAGGTQTISRKFGCLKIVTTNFDADGEVATTIDFADYAKWFGGRLPRGRNISMSVVQTAGTTNTVAISFQGANDSTAGVNFRDVVDLTKCEQGATVDTFGGCAYNNDLLNAVIPFGRIYCTTVGAGNTLTATVWVDMQD